MNVAFLDNGNVRLSWKRGGGLRYTLTMPYHQFARMVQECGDTGTLAATIRLRGEATFTTGQPVR